MAIEKVLIKKFNTIINDIKFKQKLANKVLVTIRGNAQRGIGVTNDVSKRPNRKGFDNVSDRYAKWRRKVINRGKPFPTADKSKATLTGQMLRAMRTVVLSNGFKVFIDNTNRSPIKYKSKVTQFGKKGQKLKRKKKAVISIKPKLTNKGVALEFGKNRPFMALSKKDQKVLFKLIDDEVSKRLKKVGFIKFK